MEFDETSINMNKISGKAHKVVLDKGLPCPFCGNKPIFGREYTGSGFNGTYGNYYYHLECNICELEFGFENIEESNVTEEKEIEIASKFIDKWNSR